MIALILFIYDVDPMTLLYLENIRAVKPCHSKFSLEH